MSSRTAPSATSRSNRRRAARSDRPARDAAAGYAGLFRLNGLAEETFLFQPRGVDLSRRYAVTLDNRGQTLELSGAELALQGLPIRLEGAYTSELVLWREI